MISSPKALAEWAWTCWLWSVSFMCHITTTATIFTAHGGLNPSCKKKKQAHLVNTYYYLQWLHSVNICITRWVPQRGPFTPSETRADVYSWCTRQVRDFYAIRLRRSCWRRLSLTSCHLLASYLWRIRKLHHQTTKWAQKCKVHSQQLFSSVLAWILFLFFFTKHSESIPTGFIACIRCSTYSSSRYLFGGLLLLLVC